MFSVSRMDSKFAFSSACSSGAIGALLSGVSQSATFWYTVREATSSAIAGTICTPLDPVPIRATRLPEKSTGVFGHRPVWCCSPRKSPRPGMSGMNGTERMPVAATTKRARCSAPSEVRTVHVPDGSS